MFVTVIPVGLLRDYAVISCQYHLPCTEATIRELLQHLAIPSELVAVVLVNGRQRPKSHGLATGDVVKLVPLMGGG